MPPTGPPQGQEVQEVPVLLLYRAGDGLTEKILDFGPLPRADEPQPPAGLPDRAPGEPGHRPPRHPEDQLHGRSVVVGVKGDGGERQRKLADFKRNSASMCA